MNEEIQDQKKDEFKINVWVVIVIIYALSITFICMMFLVYRAGVESGLRVGLDKAGVVIQDYYAPSGSEGYIPPKKFTPKKSQRKGK